MSPDQYRLVMMAHFAFSGLLFLFLLVDPMEAFVGLQGNIKLLILGMILADLILVPLFLRRYVN